MEFIVDAESWSILHQGQVLIGHRPDQPCCFVGTGIQTVSMYRGNFEIEDFVEERVALRHCLVQAEGAAWRVSLARDAHVTAAIVLLVRTHATGAVI